MTLWSRITLAIAGSVLGGSIAHSQTTPGAAPREPLLGRVHIWAKIGRAGLGDAAARAWGIGHEGYFALEAYHGDDREVYVGGEIGRFAIARTTNEKGNTIRDFDFQWLELGWKKAFGLKRGLTIDAGLGGALFYVSGEDVSTLSGQTTTDPLADIGFGAQGFVDFNWRVRRMLLGLDAKYQWAFDVISIDYSNLRLGAHLGLAF